MLCNIYDIYRYAFLKMDLRGMKFYEDIVSNIRGLCCGVCLGGVWQLLRQSFHFPVSLLLCCFPHLLQSHKFKLLNLNSVE